MKNEILKIMYELSKNKIAYNLAAKQVLDLFDVSYCDLRYAKLGDKIIFSKVFKQSKRYTVGVEYEFIKVKQDEYRDQIAVRDDRGRLAWICRHGISFSEYKILSCS